MRIIVTKSYEEMSKMAARIFAGQLYVKPASVLGLATGSTPLGLYKELIALYQSSRLDFSEAVSFNLDEYIGLKREDVQSYHYFMKENLFSKVNIRPENIYIPRGDAPDIQRECQLYDSLIAQKGGIDLQVLGIGRNAHIGFNEPDDKFEVKTHKVCLKEETIKANARFFANPAAVPHYAISMGIKTIMQAKKILLLANGKAKAEAIYETVCGGVCPSVPASILQLHCDVDIILDEAAASLLPNDLCKFN